MSEEVDLQRAAVRLSDMGITRGEIADVFDCTPALVDKLIRQSSESASFEESDSA